MLAPAPKAKEISTMRLAPHRPRRPVASRPRSPSPACGATKDKAHRRRAPPLRRRREARHRPAVHGPQRPRRRLRHHRTRRRQGDGGRESITGTVQVFNLPGAGGTVGLQRDGQREGQRQARHADGPRRRRRGLHAEVQGHAQRHHPDRQADRGGRRDRRAQGLARTQTSTTSSRPGRRTRRSSPSAAAPRPAAPTTCCRCSSPRPSASTPRRSATSRTTAAASCSRRCSATRSPSAPRGFGEFLDQVEAGDVRVLAVTSERAGRRAQGRARRSRSRASTWSSPTGAASWRPPGLSDGRQARSGSTP